VTGIGLLTWRLLGPLPAAIADGLLALDPFYLAHSRLLTRDGLPLSRRGRPIKA